MGKASLSEWSNSYGTGVPLDGVEKVDMAGYSSSTMPSHGCLTRKC
ncbi:hypothetical protein MKW98_009869 [Papaver atlanticum]|uniref:Uncharacterized protein n=1 Tax=Papaver atlanticum TaxID=357466 RepID=A0AAD4XU64_9MAGN|nr:hypothetical protein MKW98_009869 [Papaver atlanticum]